MSTEPQGPKNETAPSSHTASGATPVEPEPPKPTVVNINAEVINIEAKQTAVHTDQPADNQQIPRQTLENRIKKSDRLMILLTAIIATTGFFGWVEVRNGGVKTGAQTDNIIEADNRIAAAMEGTIWQARRALNASIEQFRLDQRAWIGPKAATGAVPFKTEAPDLAVGRKITMGIIIGNSGKTPALHLKGTTDIRILPKRSIFMAKYRPLKDTYLIGDTTLAPSGSFAMMAPPSDEVITQPMLDELKATSSILYLFGYYTYNDVSGTPHFTKVCMFALRDLNGMASCNTYNDAN